MSRVGKLSLGVGVALAVILAVVALPREEVEPGPPRRAAPRSETQASGPTPQVYRPATQTSMTPDEPLQPAVPQPVVARFSRAADEWQGMLPDPDDVAPCSPDGLCAKARACIEGKCVPCASDGECNRQELCVLGHCVLENLVECQSQSDCDVQDALCILTEYDSLDPRGNLGMRAICLESTGVMPGAEEKLRADLAAQEASIMAAPPSGPSPQERVLALFKDAPTTP